MGRKYKNALEKTGPTRTEAETGSSHKITDEIKYLLSSTSFPHSANTSAGIDLNDTKSLQEICLSLLETLKDRMTQLKQLRRANKQIMSQLAETEDRYVLLQHTLIRIQITRSF